jgi:hypothetical protein
MNYPCPHCGNPNTHRHGDRRFKCLECSPNGKTFTPEELKKSDNGRPPDGDRAMTGYERLKKHLKLKKGK